MTVDPGHSDSSLRGHNSPTGGGTPAPTRRRSVRRTVGNASASLISLGVIGLAVLYVAGPTSESIALTTTSGSSTPSNLTSYRLMSAVSVTKPAKGVAGVQPAKGGSSQQKPKHPVAPKSAKHPGKGASNGRPNGGRGHHPSAVPAEVVYGVITGTHGAHVSGATVTLSPEGRGDGSRGAQITVGSAGTYRSVLHLASDRYLVTVRLSDNGRRLVRSTTLTVQNGRAYRISVVASSDRFFSFLPVSSY